MDLLNIDEVFPITASAAVIPVSEASGVAGQVIQKLAKKGLLDIATYSDTGAGNRAEEAVRAARQLYSQLKEAHNLR
jgi:hypothetical protein